MRFLQRYLKQALCVCALAAMLAGSMLPARAGDWSIEAKTTHQLSADVDDNTGADDGYVLGLLNSVYADAIYQTDVSRFDLIGKLSYRDSWDLEDGAFSDRLTPGLETKYNHKTKQTILDVGASWSRDEVRYSDLLDSLTYNSDAYRDVFNANGSLTYLIDQRNSAGVRASFSQTLYDENVDDLVERRDVSVGTFWTRRMTKRSDLSTTASFAFADLDDKEDTRRRTLSLQTSLTTRLSSQLKWRIGGGSNVIFSEQNVLIGDDEWSTYGWNADVGFDYEYKRGAVSAAAKYGTDTTLDGEFVDRFTLSGTATRSLTERSGLEAAITARFQEPDEDDGQTAINVSAAFSHRMTDEWKLRTGFSHTWINEDAGDRHANSIFMSLSRDWVVKP
jgi:hypothetical protein